MHEIRVLFSTPDGGKGYVARLTDAQGKDIGVRVPFTPFLAESDYEDLRWYLEDYLDLPDGGSAVRAARIEGELDRWGRKLCDALFAADGNRALKEALLSSPEPRELTLVTQDPAILRLPWELMADSAGSLAQRVSVRRQVEEPAGGGVARPAKLPLRILYIVSRPSDAGFIDPRLTARELLNAVDPLGANVRVDFCGPPTAAKMEEMLREAERAGDPYGIVHFDGHGVFQPEAQMGALCFEKPDDGAGGSGTDPVPADRLGDLLAGHAVPLVVLEACRSGAAAKSAVFRSVAPRLIRAGVGSVLCMSHAVHVEAARRMLDRFYRELACGVTVGHAVAQARTALRAAPGRWIEGGPRGRAVELIDWFLPHLYQRASDDVLIPPDAAAGASVRRFDLFLSHQQNDSARVEGLARLIENNHGLRVWLDMWECVSGNLKAQCEKGIRESRFTVVAGSKTALESKWVRWEIKTHRAGDPDGKRLIPVKFEELQLPPRLDRLLWVDFTDPAKDVETAKEIARQIRHTDAEDARRVRGFRAPGTRSGDPGAFPPSPPYGFCGRARELHELERLFRFHRGILLHAMGGMGKTALATEAAHWWTRSGLFRDGACFVSFEQFASADRVVQILGSTFEGPTFDRLSADRQRRDAVGLFREKEVLLVWDNFESALPQYGGRGDLGGPYTEEERRRLFELFSELTGGPGKGRLLVTCRPGETGLPAARHYELRGLAREDSLWLLSRILKRNGIDPADPRLGREELDPLLDDLSDHPLSIELVGPHLRTLAPEAVRADFGKLLEKFRQDAPEGRNRSLLASLEFSLSRLSAAAHAVLPWLSLFRGGVFEQLLLDVSGLSPEVWEPVRCEFQGIALVRVEDELKINGHPYLRFHPTLAYAAAGLAEKPETRGRFVEVYLALMQMLDEMLRGSRPRAALEVLAREEANCRTVVRWAVEDEDFRSAAHLGRTFRTYLEMSGRLREHDAWVEWLKDAVAAQGFTEEAAVFERQHAWTRFTRGDPEGAVKQLEALIERLRRTTEFDPFLLLATATVMLGRMLDHSGNSTRAVPILLEAVDLQKALVEKKGGRPWDALLTGDDWSGTKSELRNLAVAMSDLANALMHVGQYGEALAQAEESLEIDIKLGHHRNVAAGHNQCAAILTDMGRYKDADARYTLALAAAQEVGDKGLMGSILQYRGSFALELDELNRAASLYRKALSLFQEANDERSIMRTCNFLGTVESKAGRFAEARAWYEKSREMAGRLEDPSGLGATAQNIGIVRQKEGQVARARGDEPAARRHFDEALRSVEEGLRISRSLDDELGEAASLSQLAQIHLLCGDLDSAERHAGEALRIRESLGLKESCIDYSTLSRIAQVRGDAAAAAEWARKRDDIHAKIG